MFLFLLSQQQITDSLFRVGEKICSFLLTEKTELHVGTGRVIRVQVRVQTEVDLDLIRLFYFFTLMRKNGSISFL